MYKKNILLIIASIVVCILAITVIAKLYLKNMVTCQMTDISIHNILEYPGGTMTVDDFLKGFSKDFGLDTNVKNNIRLEPQKYRIINIHCSIHDKSNFIALYNVDVIGNYNQNLSKIAVGKIDTVQSDDSSLSVQSKENLDAQFMFIVKADSEKNEEILQYLQKSNFLLEGYVNVFNKHIYLDIVSKK